jgi:malate synthase
MNETYLARSGLSVATPLANFVERDVLPGTGIDADIFWSGTAEIYAHFAGRNAELLAKRNRLQARIDDWHRERAGQAIEQSAYQAFLREIGYLEPRPAPFEIAPRNVDREVAAVAGPQLVVPVSNARFLLNAANARWGSLYDALYGTDAIPGSPASGGYDPARGELVIGWAKDFLDRCVPLQGLRWAEWTGGGDPPLADPASLVGHAGDNVLLRHHGLHIELVIDRTHPIGKHDRAGIADVLLEAAITTIADLEDSIAAVDAEDKVAAYANWLGLMRADLQATFEKGGRVVTRRLAPDRHYVMADGTELVLPGRSLMFVRNVGHLMTTPAVRLSNGEEAPEGILDAIITSLCVLHDLQREQEPRNSREGSIYIVKPKMHGPEECAFTNDLFDAVEDLLGLARHTIKVGIMDEERRTSANLAACIRAVKDRVVFINTGFLDRTGDEIHTSMLAGPMIRKGDMKRSRWISAYEDRNVQIGLACGFSGKALIGKGLWPAPDLMNEMLEQKIGHCRSGASTAWVPNPTAATLHATHYHLVDVFARQRERSDEAITPLEQLLEIPTAASPRWSEVELRDEVENNVQGILGYVARWVDQGVGCSKIPDIHVIGLMEDRATLRISSQHIANWLLHGVVTPEFVDVALRRMAAKVDQQNAGVPHYREMSNAPEASWSFQAARILLFEGTKQPNGYTEPLLHYFRRQAKRGSG